MRRYRNSIKLELFGNSKQVRWCLLQRRNTSQLNPQNPENSLDLLDLFIKEKKPIALGEIGLDRFRDYSPFDLQARYFISQIQLARKHDLPILIHCRDAWSDLLPILEDDVRNNGPLKGILHSFTGTLEHAQHCLRLGLYLSFAGMITYKKMRRSEMSWPIVPSIKF